MKKGFTLVEVLAVIVILAVIFGLVTPSVINSIEKSRKNLFLTSIRQIYNATEVYTGEIQMPAVGSYVVVDIADLDIKTKNKFDPDSRVVIVKMAEDKFVYYFYVANSKYVLNGITIDSAEISLQDADVIELVNVDAFLTLRFHYNETLEGKLGHSEHYSTWYPLTSYNKS